MLAQVCAAPQALSTAVEQMRLASERQADLALQLFTVLTRLRGPVRRRLLRAILGRFEEGQDDSLFGFANALTSVARDESDPQARWRLEELGGGVMAAVVPENVLLAETDASSGGLAGICVADSGKCARNGGAWCEGRLI